MSSTFGNAKGMQSAVVTLQQGCRPEMVKDEQGVVLWEHDKIIERWKGYYGNLLNEENPRTVFGD